MKKIILLGTLFITGVLNSQTGSSRAEAIPIQPQNQCNYADLVTQGLETWYKFTAQSEKVAIELKSEKFGNNQAHVHHVKLYKGMEAEEMNHDELPFNAESAKLKINLNAGNLTVGETYYIKAERKPHIDNCNKNNCKHNNFSNPAQFKLCVENVNPYIPKDYNNEKPNPSGGFELCRGQVLNSNHEIANDIIAYNNKSYPETYLLNDRTSFVWSKIDLDTTKIDSLERIDLNLKNAFLSERVFYNETAEGHSNYYLAHNNKGIIDIKTYKRIIRPNVYNNIDWHFYSNNNGLKMYFVVNQGGNHNDIRLVFDGNTSSNVQNNGNLEIIGEIANLKFKKALVYYVNPAGNNVIMPQSGKFIDYGNNEYGIQIVETYPPNRTLIIQVEKDVETITRGENDPAWCTYYGGSNADFFTSVDSETSNVYTVGGSLSSNFPLKNEYQEYPDNSGYNAVIVAFKSNYELNFATYFGGSKYDVAHDVVYDLKTRDIYVTGVSGGGSSNLLTASTVSSYVLPIKWLR